MELLEVSEPHIFRWMISSSNRKMACYGKLSPILSNIFKEHFEKLALDLAQYKSSLWLWYVGDTFMG
jgi:hypothetical protein